MRFDVKRRPKFSKQGAAFISILELEFMMTDPKMAAVVIFHLFSLCGTRSYFEVLNILYVFVFASSK